MKFEQLFLIYLNRGLYFNARLQKPESNVKFIVFSVNGFSLKTYILYKKRFEITFQERNFKKKNLFPINYFSNQKQKINFFFSKIIFIFKKLKNILQYTRLRNYLIKSFKGYAFYLGKPIRGQRTWSNAWTAFKLSLSFRRTIKKFTKKKKKKINYFFFKNKLQIKEVKEKKKIFKKKKKKIHINIWF